MAYVYFSLSLYAFLTALLRPSLISFVRQPLVHWQQYCRLMCFQAGIFVIPKIYSNSALSSLNARKDLRRLVRNGGEISLVVLSNYPSDEPLPQLFQSVSE